ncbi:MAG: hypothetical protein M3Y22_02180 [Pseudomonadota bacterium]|nr:hypothetical protein [Pseudomonadota bacterium]
MSSRNTSRLDSGLIARKGEAAPASSPPASAAAGSARAAGALASEAVRVRSGAEAQATDTPGPARGLHGTIAVTVRLDPRRYERLKIHGARLRRTNQEILVEAFDRYFHDVKE